MRAVRGLVSGRVQGVFFRKSVQQGCMQAGLEGFAKNLPDGRVEVLLVGSTEQVERGKLIVKRGSPNSEVTGVRWEELAECPQTDGFRTF